MTARTALHLLRCATLPRVWNLLRIAVSFQLSVLLRRSIVWGKPYTLTIEPTNRCNLSCPECPSGNGTMVRPLGMLSRDRFADIVRQTSNEVLYLQLFFQGEPFINAGLVDMIREARRHRMYVSISTNAHYLRDEVIAALLDSGLQRLIISIDGLTQDVYEEYRVGGSLPRVLDALHRLHMARRAHGSRMEVVLQMLVTRQTEEHIPALRRLAREHDCEVSLKTIQVYTAEGAERFLPLDAKYRRYDIVDGELRPRSALRNRCVRLWERSVITWDGVVVPCCFDKNAEYPLGSLDEATFEDIWQSPTYHDFRDRILRDRRSVPMCTNCTEGLRIYR